MICTNCGTQNAENVKFCKACGSPQKRKNNTTTMLRKAYMASAIFLYLASMLTIDFDYLLLAWGGGMSIPQVPLVLLLLIVACLPIVIFFWPYCKKNFHGYDQ